MNPSQRQSFILNLLQGNNGGYSVQSIVDQLNQEINDREEGAQGISKRTVQNDLNAIAEKVYDLNQSEDVDQLGLTFVWDQDLLHKKPPLYHFANNNFELPEAQTEQAVTNNRLEIFRQAQDGLNGCTILDCVFKEGLDKLYHVHPDRFAEMFKHVQFEDNIFLKGRNLFSKLLKAITSSRVLKITYAPYDKEAMDLFVSPYLLKQYNGRWFLLGMTEVLAKNGMPKNMFINLAFDRIQDIKEAKGQQYINPPDTEDAVNFNENVIGVTVKEGKVQEIKFRVYGKRHHYIDTKPLHGSQKRLPELDDKGCKGYVIKVIPNQELISTMLHYGADIEVVEPQSVRDQMAKAVAKMNSYYNN